MKKITLVLLSAALIGTTLSAQTAKTKTTTKAKTVKTTTKPAVKPTPAALAPDAIKFAGEGKEEEITVDGKDFLLAGSNNKLTIKGNINNLHITGKNNDIMVESVNQVLITGSGNFASWESSKNSTGKPVIQDKGGYNNIEKRSSQALDKSNH